MKKMCLAITLILLVSGSVWSAPVQWAVSDGGNGHWYEIVRAAPDALTWEAAETVARNASFNGMQGHLATLTGPEENAFVANRGFLGSASNGVYSDTIFIGAKQIEPHDEPLGNWTWVTGEPFGWANWKYGTPSDSSGHLDYLQLHATNFDMGLWGNHSGSVGGGGTWGGAYIIEYEPASVPVPGSGLLLAAGLFMVAGTGRRKDK